MTVRVGPHPEHGTLISVALTGVEGVARAALVQQIDARLDPLALRHEVV